MRSRFEAELLEAIVDARIEDCETTLGVQLRCVYKGICCCCCCILGFAR